MIDEKRLIEGLRASMNTGRESLPINLIIECIEEQENIEIKCSNCSRRKFYQEGYQDGLNSNRWILCSDKLPKNQDDEFYPLIYITNIYGVVQLGFYREDDKQWYIWNEWTGDTVVVDNSYVIAWQPRPESYVYGQ